MGWDPIGPGHAQNWLSNFRIVQYSEFIKEWKDKDGRDQCRQYGRQNRYACAPDVPCPRQAPDQTEEYGKDDCSEHKIHCEYLQLITHPRAEGLVGEPVFMLPEIVFVNRQWKSENGRDKQI